MKKGGPFYKYADRIRQALNEEVLAYIYGWTIEYIRNLSDEDERRYQAIASGRGQAKQ